MKTIEVPPKPYRPTPDDIQELKDAVGYRKCPYCNRYGHDEEEEACPQRKADADRFVSANSKQF